MEQDRAGHRIPPFTRLLGWTSGSEELWQRLEARRPAALRFVLHLSRRPNAALCPCLEVDLCSTHTTTTVTVGTTFTVTRILDPEHRLPYITLSPIFYAAGLTLIQGLVRFSLEPGLFDGSLAGLEPWDDLWVTLPLARHIASQLELHSVLAEILSPRTALAWSLDEFNEGLSHNWRVPNNVVDSAVFSTSTITAPGLQFAQLQMLPSGQQIKTLVSAELRSSIAKRTSDKAMEPGFRLHQKMIRWTSQLWSIWTDVAPLFRLDEQHAEAEENKGSRKSLNTLVEELEGMAISPTWVDMLEWTQLSSQITSLAHTAGSEEKLLSSLSLAEFADLRSTTHAALGDLSLSLPTSHTSQDEAETTLKLHTVFRAKLASLHTINRLSLPYLGSSPQMQTEPHLPTHSISHPVPTNSTITPASHPIVNPSSARNTELAALDAKINAITAKVDALTSYVVTASRNGRQVFGSSMVQETDREPSELVSQDKPHKETDRIANTVTSSTTQTLSVDSNTSPSLIVVILSIGFFFAMIKSIDE